MTLKGKSKIISEYKVETMLRALVEKVGSKLEEGDTVEERKQFSQLLTVLAIVTDSKQLALALDMESNPDWYMGGLDSLYDGDVGDAPARPNGDRAAGEDPSAAARQQEYKEKERAAEAAAPMDEAGGEEARGAGTAPEE